MKQIYIDKIKKDYEDIKGIIESDFAETKDDSTTLGRYRRIQHIKYKYDLWSMGSQVKQDDWMLSLAIEENLEDVAIDETNSILMYVCEFPYNKHKRLNPDELADIDSEDIYILYMDIENRKKYFVRKEDRETFEETHSIIVAYQSEFDDQSANHEINNYKTFFERRDFVRYAMSTSQAEAKKMILAKYPNKSVDTKAIKEAEHKRKLELWQKRGINIEE